MAEQPSHDMYPGGGSTPVPDPTILTAQAVAQASEVLRREIKAATDLLDAREHGNQAVTETRLHAMDEAVRLLQTWRDHQPTEFDEKVHQLERLHDERFKTVSEQFKGIETQFIERDVRVKDSAAAATTAVNAALQAAKEAVGEQNKSFTLSIDKSEKSTLEQISQQRILLQTNYGALNDKIIAIDTRLTRFEGLGLGTAAAAATQQTVHTASQMDRGYSTQVLVNIIMGLVAIGALAVAILKP